MTPNTKPVPDIAHLPDRASPKPGPFLCARNIECHPWQMVRRSGCKDWLALYTFSGVCDAYQKGLLREMRVGDLLIFSPGAYQHIAVSAEENWSFFWAHFTPRASWPSLIQVNELGKKVFLYSFSRPAVRDLVESALGRCCTYHSNESPFSAELGMTCLEEAFYLGAREYALTLRRKLISPEIGMLLEHCNLTYRLQQSVKDLARIAHLSPSRLAHRFKFETGSSIMSYLLNLRLSDAAQQLEMSQRGVKAIALSVGFSSDTHFGRLFRKKYGHSPAAYRKRSRLHV